MAGQCNGVLKSGYQCPNMVTIKVTVRGGLIVSLCETHLNEAED